MVIDSILKYIPSIDPGQLDKLLNLQPLYSSWNEKVNLISRKDIGQFYMHHVLHSLSISLFIDWNPGTKILDLGTGGGFPGIPLAILFPHVEFTLVDSISKKIKVVEDIKANLELNNVRCYCARAESLQDQYDFVVSRAVAKLPELYSWSRHLISPIKKNKQFNGLIAYKGGDISDEIKQLNRKLHVKQWMIHDKIPLEYFNNKFLIYVT